MCELGRNVLCPIGAGRQLFRIAPRAASLSRIRERPRTVRNALRTSGLVAAVLLALIAASFWFLLVPRNDPQPLPGSLISLQSQRGEALLGKASGRIDYDSLSRSYEPQKLRSFCGVATSVIVLNALGHSVTQTSVFNDRASSVSPIWKVAFGGMTLDTLAGLLGAHGVTATVHRATGSSASVFRNALRHNLRTSGDFLVVNYARERLGQAPMGHISPIAAFDQQADMALVLDTADYKYPPTWVPVEALFRAMATTDPDSGRSRGWIEVTNVSAN